VRRIRVAGDRPYDVVIGDGAQAGLGLLLEGTARVAVIHAPPLAAAAGAAVETLQTAGIAAEALVVPDGEAAKSAAVAARLLQDLGLCGVMRGSLPAEVRAPEGRRGRLVPGQSGGAVRQNGKSCPRGDARFPTGSYTQLLALFHRNIAEVCEHVYGQDATSFTINTRTSTPTA